MRKFENKHLKREKEYLSLLEELEYLRKLEGNVSQWKTFNRGSEFDSLKSNYIKIKERLVKKFYNEYCGWIHTAPHHYRNMKNRKQRYLSKKEIKKWIKDSEQEMKFEDNYSDCSWYW